MTERELDLPEDGGNAVQLINAAFELDLEQTHRLVQFGVSVNAKDYDGRTALHIAASEGWVELIDFLLDADADVNAIDRFGGSPLADAVREGAKKANIASKHPGASSTPAAHVAHDHEKAQEMIRCLFSFRFFFLQTWPKPTAADCCPHSVLSPSTHNQPGALVASCMG